MSKIKAYVVTYDGWLGYFAAETASQARYDAWKTSYRDIANARLIDIKARRFLDLDYRALGRGAIPPNRRGRAYFKKLEESNSE